VAELLNWLGLPATAAIAFTAIWGAFAAFEKIASPTKKKELSSFLRSADWSVMPFAITAAFRDGFEAIFGEHQFSLKCIRRSVAFSLLAIFTLLLLGFVNHYSYFETMPGVIWNHPGYKIIFFGWLLWSIFLDFFNLYKTRLIIRLIDRLSVPTLLFFVLAVADLFFSFVVFAVSFFYLDTLNMAHQICVGKCSFVEEISWSFSLFKFGDVQYLLEKFVAVAAGPTANEVAVFFWAGLIPTLWLLLYVIATALTRWLVKISDLISFTFSWLNVDRPFEMIGFVAAFMIGLTMVVHGLVSKII
jgi:hypothetical protein